MSRSRWTAGLLVLALGLAGCAATPNGSGGTETGSVTPSRTITFSPPSLPASADSAATIDPATQCFAYAQRLSQAGVPTTLRLHPGLIHGFVNAAGVASVAADAVRELAAAIVSGLSPEPPSR